MTSGAILFASNFGMVFLLGLQSINVVHGRFLLSFIVSAMIGALNLVLFRLAPHATTVPEMVGFVLGGATAIVTAMWFNKKFLVKDETRTTAPTGQEATG